MTLVRGQIYIDRRVAKEEKKKLAKTRHSGIPSDPVAFCRCLLGFTPTPYQEKFLRDPSQFIALRWSRQSGKSYIVSSRIIWNAVLNNGSHAAIVAPSYRQSKLVLRKI